MQVTRLRVDFGDASDEHLIPARSAERLLNGAAVILFDGEGNMCAAVVSRTEGRLVWAEPIWSTWVPHEVPWGGVNFGKQTFESSKEILGTGQDQPVSAGFFRSVLAS